MADAAEGRWHEYRAWFNAKLESLEAMAARTNSEHFPEDEQDAQKFSTAAMSRRFDEIAEGEYRQWLESGSPHSIFSTRLSELQVQVLKASLKLWSLGSDILRQWYENGCQPRADIALSGRVQRWEHRARTTEIVRHLSSDRGLALASLIEKFDTLTAEEAREVSTLHEQQRLRVWIHPTSHHFEGGFSGDFLERGRLTITNVGLHLRPPGDIPPLDFCLRTLLHELVCEREPVNHPQIDRLNNDQLSRYPWAPYSGNSITPDGGQVLNLCEALKWYCQRLIGLLNSTKATARTSRPPAKSPAEVSGGIEVTARRRGRRANQERRDAIHNAIAKHRPDWRDHLPDIFKELDSGEVFLGVFQGKKIDLGDEVSAEIQKWDDLDLAQGKQLRHIVDTLRKYAD
ncbi:MAG TPA: hypothetical protein VGQ49_21860 [Bryobacteraceae bacterium]|nr:hypothetical protein [Bryobacteraceae bacterium]